MYEQVERSTQQFGTHAGRRRAWSVPFIVLATSGCGQILGVDEYKVGEPPIENPCGALQAWAGGTTCVNVGVAQCGEGFKSDGKGGCDANLGDTVCPAGQVATPGSACGPIVTCTPGHRRDPAPDSRNNYVRWGAMNGKGTADAPFGNIEDALAALKPVEQPQGFVPTIIIDDSDVPYSVNLDVTFPVILQGNCPQQTELVAADPTKPVVIFETPAKGSGIVGLKLVGGSAGVVINGVDGVKVQAAWIAATNGPGVVATDAPSSTGGSAARVAVTLGGSVENSLLIDGALGAGVLSYGANLVLDQVTIRGTRPPEPGIGSQPWVTYGKDAGGLCLRPSPWVPTLAEGDVPGPGAWDPRRVLRPTLSMTQSVLEDNAGAGLSVIGGIATVTESLVRATGTPDVPEQRIGIDVAEHPFGDVPATLSVVHSIVEGATVEGIRIRNATADIEDTVVRHIGGARPSAGPTRCLGSGIRLRWDRPPDVLESGAPAAQTPPLIVKRSLVGWTRDTGILVEGADAHIERSIVQDTAEDPCAAELGDGIGVYGHDFAPASLELTTSRIERSARAAVTAFGGQSVSSISVESAVLLGNRGIVLDPASVEPKLAHALCGATGNVACAASSTKLVSSLLGGNGCADDDTVCSAYCFLDGAQPSQTPLSGIRVWASDHDEIAPVISDSSGCYALEGLPQNAEVLVDSSKPVPPSTIDFNVTSYTATYSPGLGLVTTGMADSRPPLTIPGPVTFNNYIGFTALAQAAPGNANFEIDMRDGQTVAVFVCAARPERLPLGTDACRGTNPSYAVAGVQIVLEPTSGVGPLYVAGGQAQAGIQSTGPDPLGAVAVFMGVPPGEHQVHLGYVDKSKTLNCAFDTTHGPASGGKKPGDDGNTFRVVVGAGQAMALWAYCSLD